MTEPRIAIGAAILVAVSLAGCDKAEKVSAPPRPVRAITIEQKADGETVSLTGQVRAKDQVSLAFRLDGRMIARPVDVGDVLPAGRVVARLDPQNQQNALRSAQASLTAAQAVLAQARLAFGRQQALVKAGWTPRARFDEAQQNLRTAQAQVDSAQADLRIARDRLSYTVLTTDVPGSVTAVGAEAGEVVQAGHMIVQLAQKGGRDAVFDVPGQLMSAGPRPSAVEITLASNPGVKAIGHVREVAPQADPTTRTFQVKVGIDNPPAAMRLGTTVTGSIKLARPPGVEVPATALTEANGRPAVWIIDPHSETVSLRSVEVARYDPASIVISQGLNAGEAVVTAGVQTLHPGQKVRLLGAAS